MRIKYKTWKVHSDSHPVDISLYMNFFIVLEISKHTQEYSVTIDEIDINLSIQSNVSEEQVVLRRISMTAFKLVFKSQGQF